MAIVPPDGRFEVNIMTFLLSYSPATLEVRMDTVLRGLRWKLCMCFVDDINLHSIFFPEHTRRLEDVLSSILSPGTQLNR